MTSDRYAKGRQHIKGGACVSGRFYIALGGRDSEKAHGGGHDLTVRFVRRGACDIRLSFGGAWCFSDNYASRDGCEGNVPSTTADHRTVRLVRRYPR